MGQAPSAERLLEVASHLLVESAYIFAEPATDDVLASDGVLVSSIALGGDADLCLVVAVDESLGRALAANLLGVDDFSDEAKAAAADSVGEWSNILAGAVSEELRSDGVACRIGLPSVTVQKGATLLARLRACERKVFLKAEVEGCMAVALEQRARA
jgi:CheY-specific phosphatase CheX